MNGSDFKRWESSEELSLLRQCIFPASLTVKGVFAPPCDLQVLFKFLSHIAVLVKRMGDPGRHYLYSSPKPAENEARHSSASTADNDAERSSTRFPSRLLGRSILGNSRSPVQSAIGPSSAEFHGTSSPSGRHLARDQTAGGEISREGQLGRWDAASGNVSDAAVALKQLKNIIEDAVFLDEDAYNGVASLSQYTNTIHVSCMMRIRAFCGWCLYPEI